MNARDHERYEQDVAAYVLGALTDLERQAFERHLAGCQSCQHDLAQLRVAAEALPRSVGQYRAPDSLKDSLMATVRAEAGARASSEEPAPARLLPVLARLRQAMSPPRRRLALAGAGAVLALVLVSAAFYQLGRQADEGERTVAAQVDRSRLPEASARLVIPDDESEGAILEVNGVPRPTGRVLHVWLKRGDRVLPSSMFQVGADGSGAAGIPEDLDEVDLVMVTREAGPVPAPTEDPVLTVRVRS
jgi:anti-sigma factor RsiW